MNRSCSNTRQPCAVHTQLVFSIVRVYPYCSISCLSINRKVLNIQRGCWANMLKCQQLYSIQLLTFNLNSHDLCACCKYTGKFSIDSEQCSICSQAHNTNRQFHLCDIVYSCKQIAACVGCAPNLGGMAFWTLHPGVG